MTSKSIEVAGLRSARELEASVATRMDNMAKAEEFVRSTFGDETLGWMTALRERSGGRPMFMLARQIAKPDLQHAALFLAAERLGCGLVTLEWTSDFMSMEGGGYKRSYIDIPLGYIGNKGNLVSKNVRVISKVPMTVVPVDGKIRICDVDVPEEGVSLLKKQLDKCMCSQLAASLEPRSHKISELHLSLRNGIEGNNQLAPDVSVLGEAAVFGLLRNGNSRVPGFGGVVLHKRDRGPVRVDKVGGQLMNVLSFSLQNVAPNLVLTVTDWNGDDQIIRERYETAVSFLKRNGLNEPLQFVVPSLHDMLRKYISPSYSTSAQLDAVVPARHGACRAAKLEPSDDLTKTFIDAAKAILDAMKAAKLGE
ncbi:MAG: hypothetical protein KGH94_01550 [Candidatus Micrarchaeota archaeon]|nr:hypothetical protein [Candidatus Micrarchaeota archaeon]